MGDSRAVAESDQIERPICIVLSFFLKQVDERTSYNISFMSSLAIPPYLEENPSFLMTVMICLQIMPRGCVLFWL